MEPIASQKSLTISINSALRKIQSAMSKSADKDGSSLPKQRPVSPKAQSEAETIIRSLDRSARTIRGIACKCSDAAQARRLRAIAMTLEGAALLEHEAKVDSRPEGV